MEHRMTQAMERAKKYIDGLTISSAKNKPEEVVADEDRFFTWDNEKRSAKKFTFLYDWSYYNGVVMEGLYDIFQADSEHGEAYCSYVQEYLDAMMEKAPDGSWQLNFERTGYVDYHGADCYKTAALLSRFGWKADSYKQVAQKLYRDLTDMEHLNSRGENVPKLYTEEALGYNYWHGWKKQPRYKIWLDGIYMLQPFIAHQALLRDDEKQQELINRRLNWVAENLLAPCKLYYHAGNSKEDVCEYFWLRAMGWYGMAMVDVMEYLPKQFMAERIEALKLFVDGMLKYQDSTGMWKNLVDQPLTGTNRLETSGTAMMCYTILKGVRLGWLDESYRQKGMDIFAAMVEEKLDEKGLNDIYLRASANNTNNYEEPEFYVTDEGKGVGPFIMAYSEILYLQ